MIEDLRVVPLRDLSEIVLVHNKEIQINCSYKTRHSDHSKSHIHKVVEFRAALFIQTPKHLIIFGCVLVHVGSSYVFLPHLSNFSLWAHQVAVVLRDDCILQFTS